MTVVLKFGGTSVANGVRIRNAAKLIANRYCLSQPFARVVVVVSAMAGTTDQLSRLLQEMGGETSSEDDVVLSSGEALSTALMAVALAQLGLRAQSFLGWQLPILTDATPRQARIMSVGTDRLETCLNQGIIPVIAGFQGISHEHRLTTLGRGGSDTTAVAVAAALGAERCDIYTDVDGVYAADPRLVPFAHKWQVVPYNAMIALAGAGAKVLQARSVELAAQHDVPVRVLSSFVENAGTLITHADKSPPAKIVGIASQKDVVRFTIVGGNAEIIGKDLQAYGIPFDDVEEETDFVVDASFEERIELLLKKVAPSFQKNHGWAKISVIGEGIHENRSLVGDIFATCRLQEIAVEKCRPVPSRMSFLVPKTKENLIVNALYKKLESLFSAS